MHVSWSRVGAGFAADVPFAAPRASLGGAPSLQCTRDLPGMSGTMGLSHSTHHWWCASSSSSAVFIFVSVSAPPPPV